MTAENPQKMTQTIDNLSLSAENLKKIREYVGKTQAQMAIALGYSGFVAINRKENGVSPITRQDEIIVSLRFTQACKSLGIKLSQ
jgi:transcriptional regulator with XRE-family HTH domain